jgi:hypothetical protein
VLVDTLVGMTTADLPEPMTDSYPHPGSARTTGQWRLPSPPQQA